MNRNDFKPEEFNPHPASVKTLFTLLFGAILFHSTTAIDRPNVVFTMILG